MGFRLATRPRARLLVCAAAIVLSAASCPPNPPQPVETRISILQLNMRGIADVPNGDRAGFWEHATHASARISGRWVPCRTSSRCRR